MGKLIASLTRNESGNNNSSTATVTIGNTTSGCIVPEGVTNKGEIKIQTDGKTSFNIGHKTKKVVAKSINNDTNVTQT